MEENKIITEELDKLHQDFAKSMSDLSGLRLGDTANIQSASVDRVKNYFNDLQENRKDVADLMRSLYGKNGIVKGTVDYYQSLLTWNHSIYPLLKTGDEMSEDMEEYGEVANQLELHNVKYYAPYFLKQTLINGLSLFYEIANNKGVAYIEFPTDWGRIYAIDNNVFRWELDMSKIDEATIGLPTELQTALTQYSSGATGDENRWSDGQWYKIRDKGFAFALDQSVLNSGTSVSELSDIILDVLQLEKSKDKVEQLDALENVRILHSAVPTDKDGRPLMTAKTVKMYDSQLRRSLPKGIAGITSPMKLTNVPLSGSGNNSSYDQVKQAKAQVFLSTGTPESLFGGETTSSNIVKLAIQKDANWLYTKALPMIENYYNYKLSRVKTTSGMRWKMKFVRQSYFTNKDDVAILEKQLSMGGSRLTYLAASGMEPAEVYGTLMMEQKMLNIDSIMVPKQTSHTMSGSGATGRPTENNPTDDTIRIQDSE